MQEIDPRVVEESMAEQGVRMMRFTPKVTLPSGTIIPYQGQNPEADPNGIDQHAPGAKLDSGKLRPSLILDSMSRAITGVVQVGTFGANKYSDGGWLEVPGGIQRYRDAQLRHEAKRAGGELLDPDSGLPHDFHIAWNVLAQVELKARSGVYDVR